LSEAKGPAITLLILQIIFQSLFFLWGYDNAQWFSKPLEHQHFTEHRQAYTRRWALGLSIAVVAPLNFLFQIMFATAWSMYFVDKVEKRIPPDIGAAPVKHKWRGYGLAIFLVWEIALIGFISPWFL